MCPATTARTGGTTIDLEFATGTNGGALLGDIASSLVSLDELLRDLGSIAAYPSSVEFRKIEIVAIEMRSPLKIRLALLEISADAVIAFREICRDIIHERRSRQRAVTASESGEVSARRLANIKIALERCTLHSAQARITEPEAVRILGHIVTLQNAVIPLTRVEVKEE
jgi:hypothetical protein